MSNDTKSKNAIDYIDWLEKLIANEYFNYYEYSEFENLETIGKGQKFILLSKVGLNERKLLLCCNAIVIDLLSVDLDDDSEFYAQKNERNMNT
ncbi:hypothetical protein C1645_883066 [Glomus cerebriforme]|uniref:Uncharacterized protein n=1 Tax=Glomus cerebriforme TaxID=658196 RepID=A0A397S1V7_9GLOM|nr:hypothetical protein C1645_883066 [Glomus cerebriforme]